MEQWITVARTYLGLKEFPGETRSNPTIMEWAERLGNKVLGIAYAGDHVPWCGLFVAHCLKTAGLPTAPIAVRASSWATWGQACRATPGALAVFKRPGGGHVGFLVGQNAHSYRVLGGNQSDGVTETWIEKSRCVAIRWPLGRVPPQTILPTLLAGGAVSRNEA